MHEKNIDKINYFFVHIFNDILAWEERTIRDIRRDTNLSVREMHVIEAVNTLTQEGQNTMANIAEMLAVTRGSLSTSVDVLVKKGFLKRSYTPKDRRVIYVTVTESGKRVNEVHRQFHEEMITHAVARLNESELENLAGVLEQLTDFFKSKRLTKIKSEGEMK